MKADRTVQRAVRHGTRTQPVESIHERRGRKRVQVFTPEILAAEMERARVQRIEEDIEAYSRKAS